MNKKTLIYISLILAIIAGCYLSIASICALITGDYIFYGDYSETSLAIMLIVSLLISMLSVSGIIYNIRKNKSLKNNQFKD
ncbi:MAG: hypothetical protein PHR96_02810 [Clostridia bacterium]|nr:hypothetical protein [Clostridia bacterium]